MIAGERASPAATAVDDFMNTRRLTGAIFMGFSPSVLVTTAIVVAACFLNCRAKATARARGLPVAANRAGTVRTGEDQRISKDGSVVRSTTQFYTLAAPC